MKSAAINRRKASKEGRPCSIILLISWTLILSWLTFLLYCWKSGQLHSTKIQSLNYMDGMLTNAETSLRGGISRLHLGVPIDHLPGGPDTNTVFHHAEEIEKSDIHVIFSTDCSTYQDWQTLVVFHSATAVGQKGPITRIASGCDEEKKKILTDTYKKLYPQYHIHFTPDFKKDEKSKRSCKNFF
jgi:hypothetical protein